MSSTKTIKVWDLPVRIFHWSLVAFFVISYLSGDELETLHAWSGYVVTALIMFRILWGFIGSTYARFSNFIYSPAEIKGYLRSLLSHTPRHYIGHNPAGGVMVIVLLISLSLTVFSGLKAYAADGHGPLASSEFSLVKNAYADKDEHEDENEDEHEHEDEFWEEIHEFFSNFTLLLVFIHVAGVIVSSRIHKESLVKAMLTGYKQGD
ncbi:MAG: cytochrome b [Gammaproteobacteria bacterium]|nr:MAG: cytochrome b [Gammaproteobacteria bacterium]